MLPDIPNLYLHLFCLFLNKTNTMPNKELKALRSFQADTAGEGQEKLQSFFLSHHLELPTRLSHHHTAFKITSEAAHTFQCKAEREKRASKFLGFAILKFQVCQQALQALVYKCAVDWQRHLGSHLLCAVSHVQAGGGTSSSSQSHLGLLNHMGKSINLKLLLCAMVNYCQTHN